MDADYREFMEISIVTFESPLVEFARYSTCVLMALELDFGFELEPNRVAWFAVLDALPALQRLS